jgi:hypothetical protein
VIRLKRLEDVLEKYWNDHRMDHTIEYLITQEFTSPFDFFQEFGDYWEERGWQRIGHQLEDLFSRLHEFLTQHGLKEPEIVLGLMKLDYYLGHKYKPRKIWWEDRLHKHERNNYFKALTSGEIELAAELAARNLDERELMKYAVIEELPFSLTDVIGDESVAQTVATEAKDSNGSLLIVLYQQEADEHPVYYSLPITEVTVR